MPKCSECGGKVGLFEDSRKKGQKLVCMPCWKSLYESNVPKPATTNRTSATNAPKTGAATVAYSSAFIIAICSVISFFVLLVDNNGFLGFMFLVSGLGGAIFFMIMAEISHNVASLGRLANAKKEEE